MKRDFTPLQKFIIFFVFLIAILVLLFLYFFKKPTKEYSAVYVGIGGAVKKPKVYEIDDNIKRLYELILLAGGLKENADISKIDTEQKIKPFNVYCIPYRKKKKLIPLQPVKKSKTSIPKVSEYKEINIIYAGLPRTYLLITLIPKSNLVIVTHIPYYTLIPGSFYNSTLYETYLTGGVSFLVNSAQRITGKKVDYYFTQNREQWIKFIDILGGITVTLPNDFRKEYNIKEKIYTLDGPMSWEYIRFISKFFRKTELTVGTFYRMKYQKEFVKQMFKKLKENNFFKQGNTLKLLLKQSETNITIKTLVSVYFQFKNIGKAKLELLTLPGTIENLDGKDVWITQNAIYKFKFDEILKKYFLR